MFKKNVNKREGWQNNTFNERVWNELPRKFSLEDIDGVIRFHYKDSKGNIKTRFVIYEIKSFIENEAKSPQLKTLDLLRKSIDWKLFDEHSGIFIIKGIDDGTWDKTKVLQLLGKNRNNEFIFKEIGIVDFSYYNNWFYNKEHKKIKCIHCKSFDIRIEDEKNKLYECQNCYNQFYLQ